MSLEQQRQVLDELVGQLHPSLRPAGQARGWEVDPALFMAHCPHFNQVLLDMDDTCLTTEVGVVWRGAVWRGVVRRGAMGTEGDRDGRSGEGSAGWLLPLFALCPLPPSHSPAPSPPSPSPSSLPPTHMHPRHPPVHHPVPACRWWPTRCR